MLVKSILQVSPSLPLAMLMVPRVNLGITRVVNLRVKGLAEGLTALIGVAAGASCG